MRHARRVDSNHAAVRDALRAHGWTVDDTSHMGCGMVDLVAAKGERVLWVEVKDGNKSPSDRRLTDDEQWFHKILQRAGIQVQVIEHVAQVSQL